MMPSYSAAHSLPSARCEHPASIGHSCKTAVSELALQYPSSSGSEVVVTPVRSQLEPFGQSTHRFVAMSMKYVGRHSEHAVWLAFDVKPLAPTHVVHALAPASLTSCSGHVRHRGDSAPL